MDYTAHKAPLSMGFSRQGYWSGLPCPPLGDLSNSEIKLRSRLLHWQLGSLPLAPPRKPTGNQGSERLCHESKVIRQYSPFCFNPYFENVNVFQWNWNSKEQCEHNSHFVFAYKQVHSEEIYSKYRKLHPIFFTPWHRAMLEYTKSTHHKHLRTSYQPTMWDVNHIHSHLVLPLL